MSVKRYVLDIKHGVMEYDHVEHDYYPATTSLPMVLASDFDIIESQLTDVLTKDRAKTREINTLVQEVHALSRQRDELREALREIRAWSDIGDDPGPRSLREIDAIALAALACAGGESAPTAGKAGADKASGGAA